MRYFSRLGFALWLGVFALFASGAEQNQLASNVVTVAVAEASGHPVGHIMPNGQFMAGDMAAHSHDPAGHTHKGHSDCAVCSVVAAMAAMSVPVLALVPLPSVFTQTRVTTALAFVLPATSHTPYASRAPPLMG